MTQTAKIQSHALVLLATALVAGSFLASEKLAGNISPLSLTLLRFLGATLILLPFILFKKTWRSAIIKTMPRAMMISFFYSAFFIGLFEALKTTTSLNTGTLFTLVPLVTALLAALLLKEKISLKLIAIYLIGAAGTVWVIFKGNLHYLQAASLNQGDLIFLISVLAMCSYSISMKWLYRDDNMTVLVFCTLLGGTVWMSAAIWLTATPLGWQRLQGELAFYMAYLIIGATVFTVYLYQKTTVILGPSRVNAYIYLNPALVALILFLVDGEAITPEVVPGIILSTVSTILLQRQISTRHS